MDAVTAGLLSLQGLGILVRGVMEVLPPAAVTNAKAATKAAKLELVPSRLRPDLPGVVRSFLEDDEAFWRDHFSRAWSGDMTAEQILGDLRCPPDGSACLVATTFRPGNIRTYLSLYKTVVLVLPLEGRVEDTLDGLGITRRELIELVDMKKVLFVAPQSVERYDAAFFAELVEVGSSAVTGSRRLAAAVHADQVARNPLLILPGTALDRRTVLRALRRLAESQPNVGPVMLALADGLANTWPFYEHSLHVRGAMASIAGPLAHVSRELAKRVRGKDYFIELGARGIVNWLATMSLAGSYLLPARRVDTPTP